MTIEATRIINTGDEIKLFNDVPFYFGYSSEDDYPSDLCKKSTGDKHKQRDELDDNLRDDNDRSDLDIEQSEVSNMNLEKDSSEDRLIQEMQRIADGISEIQQDFTQGIQAIRLNLDKKRKERDKLDDNLRDDKDCLDLEKKSTGDKSKPGTDQLGSEMVNIRESELHTIPPHVSDFVKKFVTPHVTNDGEKVYPISVNDLRGTNNKFFVETTSDANQSNCKYMPGPGDITIEPTKSIKPGDELLLFYELPKDDDKLRDDNDCSDLEKKSTGKDKRKQRDELSEDDRRFVFILDNERQEFEVMIAMAKRDVEFWGKQIQEINEKEDLILGRGDELSEDDGNDIRILDFERRSYKLKIDLATNEFEFYEGEIQENTSKLNAILGGGQGGGICSIDGEI